VAESKALETSGRLAPDDTQNGHGDTLVKAPLDQPYAAHHFGEGTISSNGSISFAPPERPTARLGADLNAMPDRTLVAFNDCGEPIQKAPPFFSSEELTPTELKNIAHASKLKPEDMRQVKHELNEHGQEPEQLIVDAMKKCRVLGLGESHIWSANLGMITSAVNKLKDAGATHFAVELRQSEVDEILRTGKDPGLHHNKEEYVAMMLAARDAGLTVVGVDNRKIGNGHGPGNEHRDEGMASDIQNILKDPNAKVVWVVGANHLCCDGKNKHAAELLKGKLGAEQVTTVHPSDNDRDLQKVSENLTRPVAVKTADAPGLAKMPLTAVLDDSQRYGMWDIVTAYPLSMSDPAYGPYEDRMPKKK
jgi:hypothetical protein